MEQEMTVLNIDELPKQFDVDESELPNIVSGAFQELINYDNEVKNAIDLADKALETADYAKSKPTGWFQKAEAIQALQSFSCDSAQALSAQAKAHEISFKFLTRLTEITKYIFGLGISNLALNRSIVRELELRLSNASAEELSELAKKEILSVIRQLKAQEDILIKLDKLSKKIKCVHDENVRLNKQLEEFIEVDKHYEEKLQRIDESVKRFTEELKALVETDRQHNEFHESIAKKEDENTKELIEVKNEYSLSLAAITRKIKGLYTIAVIGFLLGVVALVLTFFN